MPETLVNKRTHSFGGGKLHSLKCLQILKKVFERINPFKTYTYDFIFGIGETCPCSETLRSCGLQFESYPLDWLYGGDFDTRVKLLLDDFTNFINKEDLEKIGERESPLPCDIYKNNYNKIVFNHDFPLHRDLRETYQVVSEKYTRRIERLYKNIERSNKILIVYIESPTTKHKVRHIKRFLKKYYPLLTDKFKNKLIDVVYVTNRQWMFPAILKTKFLKNCVLIRTNYQKQPDCKNGIKPEPYEVDLNILKQLFKNISLNRKIIKQQNMLEKWLQK